MIIPFVDEKDEIMGYKTLEEIDKEDLTYRVSALWLTNSKGEILLAKRALTKSHHPGMWGPAAAGTVEKGETYEENIIKEAEEELGLKNINPKKGPITKSKSKYKHFTHWFFYEIDKEVKEFKIQKEEVAEVKWFSLEEIKNLLENNTKECIPSLINSFEILTK
jgi:isopentenyl-diphosphate Delta-isomerase